MGLGPHDGRGEEKVPRAAETADLTRICREFNRLKARYVVIGGFAVIHHGFPRLTHDIDLLVGTTHENEARVIEALLILADRAAQELNPGEINEYGVVRVGDEVLLLSQGIDVAPRKASSAENRVPLWLDRLQAWCQRWRRRKS